MSRNEKIEGAENEGKYVGDYETPALDRGESYTVLSIEKGWYRIITELGEDYLFPPEQFEVIEE